LRAAPADTPVGVDVIACRVHGVAFRQKDKRGAIRDHQTKLGKVSSASTAGFEPVTNHQQTEEICRGRCAVDIYKLRSIESYPRAIAECSIDRRQYLQIGLSMGMRAILCDAY
jgi:hypothetical protein